jgi:mannose-6-phosphate isomerase-like protein (cupin superfamily)
MELTIEDIEALGGYPPIEPKTVIKPWGKYETTYVGSGFKVKIITVNPGQRLSLQRHKYRDERWIIVEGRGFMTREHMGDFYIETKETVSIPLSAWHRIENREQTPLVFIEVQTGNCFEEDIERKEDDYGRI